MSVGVRPPEAAIRERVQELLALVQLQAMGPRLPHELSGGQRQRVALARALAVRPRMLLLDEPFGALDARVRRELRRWLRQLHGELGVTSVFVTHDQEEALELADRVVVMNEGRIEQIGTPDQVYHHPATPFVLAFLGEVNLFHARMEGDHGELSDRPLEPTDAQSGEGRAVIYVRPHELEVARASRGTGDLHARVERIHRAGPNVRLELRTEGGGLLRAELAPERFRELALEPGSLVFVTPREQRVFLSEGEGI